MKLTDYVYNSEKKKAVLILEDINSEELQELVSSLVTVEIPTKKVDHMADIFVS